MEDPGDVHAAISAETAIEAPGEPQGTRPLETAADAAEEQAATLVQAHVRGHMVRKSMKEQAANAGTYIFLVDGTRHAYLINHFLN